MKTKKITVYGDSGHSWAKVKKSEIKALGLETVISLYSYVRGEYLYLEEDGDLSAYIDKLKELNPKIIIKFDHFHTNQRSQIRNYCHYNGVIND